ncbi:DNA polymerase domain-containing protein [Kineosporia sp. A_224]|uniref:DNA polymerase domain-containing protein n=1 Tax=Kineosporia sp. A_224 TaxID=1962180 RepID=UPI0018EA0312|nr:DNA polymerase domain-containing protein [Kineosporia sp. A_224]
MAAGSSSVTLEVAGREVKVSSPDKVVFPQVLLDGPAGAAPVTKLDLVRYYLTVADGALRGVAGRPMILKRFVKGIDQEAFFQKRVPSNKPDWLDSVTLHYRSGTSAEEVVVRDAAGLAWVVNLGCVDLNPHPVRAEDLDRPDELRIDLDPLPGVPWEQTVEVALVVREVLADHGLVGWPKTSGSRGFHIYARVDPLWAYPQVRLAAQSVAREVENRAPDLATSRWWKEEREGVFVDFNQNAKDRTVASAYSVRPTADARVSTPLTWDEVPGCRPERFTLPAVLARYADLGDPWAGIETAAGSLEPLLALAERLGPAEKPPRGSGTPDGRRQSTMPLVEVARTKTKPEALEALERWKARHPGVVPLLEPADVLVDGMRGSSSVWYRVRVNLQHVPEADRPEQGPLEADYDPWVRMRERMAAYGAGQNPVTER